MFTVNRIQWFTKSGLVFAYKLTRLIFDTRLSVNNYVILYQCIFISLQHYDLNTQLKAVLGRFPNKLFREHYCQTMYNLMFVMIFLCFIRS